MFPEIFWIFLENFKNIKVWNCVTSTIFIRIRRYSR